MKKLLLNTVLLVTLLITGCGTVKMEENKMTTKIQLIRNATMKIEYAGKTFLTDPMFSEKGSLPGFLSPDQLVNPTSALPLAYESLTENIDGIILSHTHIPAEDLPTPPSDHFDPLAIEVINKGIQLYAQPFDVPGLKRVGFNKIAPVEQSIDIDGIKVTRVIGEHVDIDQLIPMIGESSGYVFEKEGHPTLLWTGDTLLTDEIKQAITKHSPDIIITHSGGAQLPIDAEGNKATLLMDDKATVEVAQLAPQAKIVAVHLEALDHCPVTRVQLRSLADASGISSDQLLIPENGEVLEF